MPLREFFKLLDIPDPDATPETHFQQQVKAEGLKIDIRAAINTARNTVRRTK